jgi:mono/diheme cytochrome c family protein
MSRTFALVVAAAAVAGCHPAATVSSTAPKPAAAPAAAPAPMMNVMPAAVTPAAIAEGKTLFEGAPCARCHGMAATGAANGPNLADQTWVQIDGSYDSIVKIIKSGVPLASIKGTYPRAMRPLGGATLTDAQVNSVAAYIYSLSHK